MATFEGLAGMQTLSVPSGSGYWRKDSLRSRTSVRDDRGRPMYDLAEGLCGPRCEWFRANIFRI